MSIPLPPERTTIASMARCFALAAIPLLILGSIVLISWPGYLSHDAAFQWHQARTGVFAEVAPPLLPALWRIFLWLGFPASSGPLLLILGLHVFAFARLALVAYSRGETRLALTHAVLGPACPLLLLLIPHVWSDLLLSGALLGAVALLAGRRLSAISQFAFLGLCLIAVSARHNGIFAVLPLVVWWISADWREHSRLRKSLVAIAVLAVLVLCKSLLTNALVTQRLDTWAVAPMFDLQAVSVATDRQLFPASLTGPGMDVEQLRAAFTPYTSPTLFGGTRSGVANPTIAALSPVQRADLLHAWRQLWFEPAWWAHRSRLFAAMLGPHATPELRDLADMPGNKHFGDNPPLQPRFPTANANYRTAADVFRVGPIYAPALYLALGVLGLWAMWKRRRRERPVKEPLVADWWTAAVAISASAWCYTLPYFVIAPSADTRYVFWPALASWLVFLISLANTPAPRTSILSSS